MTPLTKFLVESKEEFKEKCSYDGVEIDGDVDAFLDSLITRAYELGQQNPLTGFLRQYLNERYGIPENLWTDEQILGFLRIPFPEQPSDKLAKGFVALDSAVGEEQV